LPAAAFADQRGRRILRGTTATITLVSADQDGTALAPSGAVTVGVTRGDGSAVVPAGTAATTSGSTVTASLTPAQTAALDLLESTWTDAGVGSVHTRYHEVVGGHYVSLADLRWQTNLGSDAKFPDDRLIEARRWFEDLFEQYTGVAWVPRYRKAFLDTWGTNGILVLPDSYIRTLRSLSYTNVAGDTIALTGGDLVDVIVDDSGVLSRRSRTWWPPPSARTITVAYEYGLDFPPADVVEAAKVAIADRVTSGHAGNRQYSVATQAGIVRSSTPGPKSPFGIQFVDEVANRRRERLAAFA